MELKDIVAEIEWESGGGTLKHLERVVDLSSKGLRAIRVMSHQELIEKSELVRVYIRLILATVYSYSYNKQYEHSPLLELLGNDFFEALNSNQICYENHEHIYSDLMKSQLIRCRTNTEAN